MSLEYAVVDFETTGLENTARIIEVGIVVVDARMRVREEYETLIDPQRDLGRTEIHGITPSMVSVAPTFSDIAVSLREKLDGRVFVAHNVAFDARMLRNEFQRMEIDFDRGGPICTLGLTGDRLPSACRNLGVDPPMHHRALSDAQAAMRILRAVGTPARCAPMRIGHIDGPICIRTHRRCVSDESNVLDRLLSRLSHKGEDYRILQYLDLLDWVLDDAVITKDEQSHLRFFAEENGLTVKEIHDAHERYFAHMVAAAEKDGVITQNEHCLLKNIAEKLGVLPEKVPEVSDTNDSEFELVPGLALCFTGTFVGSDGESLEREEVEQMALAAGFQVVPRVTKSKCDALVAVDAESASGKTKQARKFGKPIIPAQRFLEQLASL